MNWKLIAALVFVPYVVFFPLRFISGWQTLEVPAWLGWVGLGLGLAFMAVYAIIIVKWAPIGTTLVTGFYVGAGNMVLRKSEDLILSFFYGKGYVPGMIDIFFRLMAMAFLAVVSGLILMAVVGVMARFVEPRTVPTDPPESGTAVL